MSAAPSHTIHAQVPGAEYDILVQPGILSSLGQHLRSLSKSPKAAVITDSHVGPIHGPTLLQSLEQSGFSPLQATIPAGEDHKSLKSLLPVYDQFLESAIERNTPVIALGGGVIGDMAGFVAATILRGVPFIQVPTTLLSMVDASIGGKTGVNHAVGKNLIGAFHQPLAVFIDPQVLSTLPPRELRSGLAECIKHDIIRDADGFASLEKQIARALALDIPYLTDLVAHNVAIKARVVAADPFERGERAHLNFGHTFGHAIETVSRYSYAHGECVALGMIAAARASVQLGMIDQSAEDRITHVIHQAQLPTGGLKLPVQSIIDAMAFDKKVKSGRIRFVLPTRIGQVTIRDDVPPDIVHQAIQSLCN